MHCKPGIFATAGTKDKRAVTVQQVTAFKVTFPLPFLPAALVLFFIAFVFFLIALVRSSAWGFVCQAVALSSGSVSWRSHPSSHATPLTCRSYSVIFSSSLTLIVLIVASCLFCCSSLSCALCQFFSHFFQLFLGPRGSLHLLLPFFSNSLLYLVSALCLQVIAFQGRSFLLLPFFVFLLSCLFPVVSCPSCFSFYRFQLFFLIFFLTTWAVMFYTYSSLC